MPQTNYTPILIYASGTTGNTPAAGNLTNSAGGAELAINYFDGRLFYKDASNVVQVLATKGTATIGGSNTQVQFNSSGSLAGSANMVFDGTRLTVADFADSSLTSGRVTYAGTGGALTDSASLTFNGTTFGTPNVALTSAANSVSLGLTGYSLTGSNAQSMLDLSGTWNTTGTPTALKLNITDTASNAASLLLDLQVGGGSRFRVTKSGSANFLSNVSLFSSSQGFVFNNAAEFQIISNANTLANVDGGGSGCFNFGSRGIGFANDYSYNSVDLRLVRDAADTLAQRRTTNPQVFRIYNTFTDASNYERGFLGWSSNVLTLGTQRAGTGSNRSLSIDSSFGVSITANNNGPFTLTNNGNLPLSISTQTNSVSINVTDTTLTTRSLVSATLANGPGVLTQATLSGGTNDSVVFRSQGSYTRSFSVGAAGQAGGQPGCDFYLFSGTANGGNTRGGDVYLYAPSGSGSGRNGQIILQNDGTNTYAGLICFGGITASFPALKRSSTTLQVRLADDSGDAPLSAANLSLSTTGTSYIVSLGGNSARTVGMERHTTANTAGNNLTILAGGATSGATDKVGGNLVLSSGTATGTGSSIITFLTATAGAAGTADRAPTEKARIDGSALLVGTTTNTNSSTIVSNGTISETVSGTQYLVASQYDVGTNSNQIPLNQYLGALAYQDSEWVQPQVGTGITAGTGTICKTSFATEGGVKVMRVLIDLTGLNSGGTANDIIGVNGTANPCYIAQIPSSYTVLGGRMTCLETPAGGDTDIDLYSATEGTGVEDQAITALTETLIINAGAQTAGTVTYFSADPAANTYFYLAGQGTANATYTAGRFLIEVFGA